MDKNSQTYQDWLLKAENDLKAAEAIFAYYEQPPTDTICYHCHQAAEKMLKGFLIYNSISFPKMHDLIVLLNLCLQKDTLLESLRESLKTLNKYYLETKYPLDMPINYSKEEAQDAIDKAIFVSKAIKDKIGGKNKY